VVGDAGGNLMVLDLAKKMRVCKVEVGSGRRVQKISIVSDSSENGDKSLV
jgi:hypothetical protein